MSKYNFKILDIRKWHEELCIPAFHSYYEKYKTEIGFTYSSPNKDNFSSIYGRLWDSVNSYLSKNPFFDFDLSYPEAPWTGRYIKGIYHDFSHTCFYLDGTTKMPRISKQLKDLFNVDLHKVYLEKRIEASIKRFFLLGGIDLEYLIIDKIFANGFNSIKDHFSDENWNIYSNELIRQYKDKSNRIFRFKVIHNAELNANSFGKLSLPLIGLDNKTEEGLSSSYDWCFMHNYSWWLADNIQYDKILSKNQYQDYLDTYRYPENFIRDLLGIPKIGEGWVTETKLYYLFKEKFNQFNVIHHGKPKWLGKQHLDIYIPELSIGVEYQGEQHYDSIEYFGGAKALRSNKERDLRKKELCFINGLKLYEVYPNDDFENIINQLFEKHVDGKY